MFSSKGDILLPVLSENFWKCPKTLLWQIGGGSVLLTDLLLAEVRHAAEQQPGTLLPAKNYPTQNVQNTKVEKIKHITNGTAQRLG